jgi:two-component system, cell cycle sensor histidine kinase and response regulator CckA
MNLNQREQLLQAVFENAPLGIAIADAGGRFVEVNQAFLEMLGYTREEARALSFIDITHPEDRAETLRLSEAARRGEAASYRMEKRYVTKAGDFIWVVDRVTVLRDAGGAVLYWVGIIESIMERRQAEKERQQMAAQAQQAQKMEAIGTLAGGIAHDFNNLLMAIQGNISLLLLNKEPHHRDTTYLKNIETAVQRASELTRQIVGFARGGKYEVRATDLNQVLAKTADMFGRSKKEITVHTHLQRDLWTVEADQSQIEQVLLGMFVNAWQAMPDGGELRLTTTNTVVDPQDPQKPPDAAPGRYACIAIVDTGIGMDAAVQARIFEPFFTTKAAGQATGLGLSSAFGIIKNHRGFITVQSQPGRGSIFRIYLPAAERERALAPPPRKQTDPTVHTVLLVEDEEIVAEIGRQMLERLGYRVLLARSGAEALALYARQQAEIDLVILDMIMPGMGGGAVFDQLRDINPQAPVLLSSGYSLNGQALHILKRGCRGFIQKPFSIEQLEQKIRESLSGS